MAVPGPSHMHGTAATQAGSGLPRQANSAIALAVVSPNLNPPTWVGWVGGGQWGEAEHPVGYFFFCLPLGSCPVNDSSSPIVSQAPLEGDSYEIVMAVVVADNHTYMYITASCARPRHPRGAGGRAYPGLHREARGGAPRRPGEARGAPGGWGGGPGVKPGVRPWGSGTAVV